MNSGERMTKLINKTNGDFQAKRAAEAAAAGAESATEIEVGSAGHDGWGGEARSVTNEDDPRNLTDGNDAVSFCAPTIHRSIVLTCRP